MALAFFECDEEFDTVFSSTKDRLNLNGSKFTISDKTHHLIKSVKSTDKSLKSTFNTLVKKFKIKFDANDTMEEMLKNLMDVLYYEVHVYENANEIVSILTHSIYQTDESAYKGNVVNTKYCCPRIAIHFDKNDKVFSHSIECDYDCDYEGETTTYVKSDYSYYSFLFNQNMGYVKLLSRSNRFTGSIIGDKFSQSWYKYKKNFILNVHKMNVIKFSLSYMDEDALYLGRSVLDRSIELYNMLVGFHPYTIQFIKKYKFSITCSEYHKIPDQHHPLYKVDDHVRNFNNVNDDHFLNIILDTDNVKYPKYIKKYLSILPARFKLNDQSIRELISDWLTYGGGDKFFKKEVLPLTGKEINVIEALKVCNKFIDRKAIPSISLSELDNVRIFTKKYYDKYDLSHNLKHLKDYLSFISNLIDQAKDINTSNSNPYDALYKLSRTPLSLVKGSIYYHNNINRIDILKNEYLVARYGTDSTKWHEIISSYVNKSGVSVKNITESSELTIEGAEMHHCVGGYTHSACTGDSFLFSLRDSENHKERSTVEIKYSRRKESFYIAQNNSYNNSTPSDKLVYAGNELLNKIRSLYPDSDSYYSLSTKYISSDQFYKAKDRKLTSEEVTQIFKEFRGLVA